MKKVFAIASVAVALVACNAGSDKKVDEVKTSDTTTVVTKPDTLQVVKDTTVKTTVTTDTINAKK